MDSAYLSFMYVFNCPRALTILQREPSTRTHISGFKVERSKSFPHSRIPCSTASVTGRAAATVAAVRVAAAAGVAFIASVGAAIFTAAGAANFTAAGAAVGAAVAAVVVAAAAVAAANASLTGRRPGRR